MDSSRLAMVFTLHNATQESLHEPGHSTFPNKLQKGQQFMSWEGKKHLWLKAAGRSRR